MSDSTFPPIQQRLMRFVKLALANEAGAYTVSKLVGDASARQYFRFINQQGKAYILAAYPEPFEISRFPYLQIYNLFRKLEIPVPRILQLDGELGIVLQEDLGDLTLQKHFVHCSSQERMFWLRTAIDDIVKLQRRGGDLLEEDDEANHLAFDVEKLVWEFQFFHRHFLVRYRNLRIDDEAALLAEFRQIAEELAGQPRVLCHRDLHVRNLMLFSNQLHVIDFQDARWGPPTYDLVSLLKDSLSLSQEEQEELVNYFLSGRPELKEPGFDRQFQLMSVQRLLKALGTYGYQVNVRENYLYEQYMRGSLERVRQVLVRLPELTVLKSVIDRALEPFPGPVPSE